MNKIIIILVALVCLLICLYLASFQGIDVMYLVAVAPGFVLCSQFSVGRENVGGSSRRNLGPDSPPSV